MVLLARSAQLSKGRPLNIGALEAAAAWKEGLHNRIEAALTRCNLGLPDDDLFSIEHEVQHFVAYCRRLKSGVVA